MARGVLSGIFWGAVVAGLGMGALSLLSGDVGDSGRGGVAPVPAAAPSAAAESPETGAAMAEEPAIAPLASEGGTGQGTGQGADAGQVAPAAPPAAAPESNTPPVTGAAIPAPEVGAQSGEAPAVATSEASPALSEGGPAPAVPEAGAKPAAPSGEAVPSGASGPPANPEVQTDSGAVISPAEGGRGAGINSGEADMAPAADRPELSGGGAPEEPFASSAPPASPGQDNARSNSPGSPAGSIGNLAENVTTGRLPSIGQPSQEPATTLVTTPINAALSHNAEGFDNSGAHPVMAVLLRDGGAERTLLGDLKNLPFPVSFVVDAAAADAAEAIRFYRDGGAEVVLAVALPEGAGPGDVETILQAHAPLLRDVVAVMIPKEAAFQTLGDTAAQVAVVLADSGHGLITMPQGLNTGHKLALKEGVAAGLVFREFDNDGQTGVVIRRFLDNAAFKARVEGGVIMLGHARAETMQALIEWSLGNRAKSVALAPVSAVLRGE